MVANQDAIQIDVDVNCASLQCTEMLKCRTYCNIQYNIILKHSLPGISVTLITVYGGEQKGPLGHTSYQIDTTSLSLQRRLQLLSKHSFA